MCPGWTLFTRSSRNPIFGNRHRGEVLIHERPRRSVLGNWASDILHPRELAKKMRRGEDSNLRRRILRRSALRGRCIQPLCHLSPRAKNSPYPRSMYRPDGIYLPRGWSLFTNCLEEVFSETPGIERAGAVRPSLRSRAEGRIRTCVFHPGGVLLYR
jgi:hypothetical protein